MTFENPAGSRRARLLRVPLATIGLGVLLAGGPMALAQSAAFADGGAVVSKGYACPLTVGVTDKSFANVTPSGNAQSSCHAGPDHLGPASGQGAMVFHDDSCFTGAGVQTQSTFVLTPSGGENGVCLANPGH